MNRKKILTIVLVIVVVGSLPNWVPIPSKSTLVSQRENNLNQITAIQEHISKARHAQNDVALDTKIAEINQAIPDGPDLPRLIDDIGKVAVSSGLSWVAGAPQKVPGLDGASEPIWTISISLTGKGMGLPNFFDNLRKSKRIITVDNVSYQSTASGEVNATAILRFYASSMNDNKE